MVPKKPKPITDKEAEEIMAETKTDHSTHLRTKIYDCDCFWCKSHGYV